MKVTSGVFSDDFDDESGIDAEESSGYTHEAGGYVRVADEQPSAVIVSVMVETNYHLTAVELVAAYTGSPVFGVSADDGAHWTEVSPESPASIPAAERGRKLRLRATLSTGDTLEFWSANY